MAKIDSQLVGAMGETIVLYELMYRGWIPANVNAFVKNARNIDVIAIKGKRQVAISVKTSGPNSGTNFQLGGEPNSKVFNRHIGAQAIHLLRHIAKRRLQGQLIVPSICRTSL